MANILDGRGGARRAGNVGTAGLKRDGGDDNGRDGADDVEAQHHVHHGRRHRLDAGRALSPRPLARGNAQHRPNRARRRPVHGLLRHAELHLGPQRLLHRYVSAAHRHDPASTARQPDLSQARHADGRQVPARSRLHDRAVRQEPSRRPHRGLADRPRLPGILRLPLPSRRDGAGELPGHQQGQRTPRRSRRRARIRRFRDCPIRRAPSTRPQMSVSPRRGR